MTGDVGPSGFQSFFRELLSEFEQLPRGQARFRAGLDGAQLGDGLFPDGDLDRRARVLPDLADQLRQPFSCFADREFHNDEVYKGVQEESTKDGPRMSKR